MEELPSEPVKSAWNTVVHASRLLGAEDRRARPSASNDRDHFGPRQLTTRAKCRMDAGGISPRRAPREVSSGLPLPRTDRYSLKSHEQRVRGCSNRYF
jgi:hypothetical protein